MTASASRRSPASTRQTSRTSSSPMRWRSAAIAATGGARREPPPLAENGFFYIADSLGILYKIDATSGDVGRIVWTMDPKQEKPANNRGAAFWGNLVISPANWPARIVATDKETGKVVWEANMSFGPPQLRITAAPLAIKDERCLCSPTLDRRWSVLI